MPQRSRHQDLDFEIHVDPSSASEPMDEKLPTMEHEDVAGAEEATPAEQGSHASASEDDTITNNGEIKQSVEETDADDTPAEDSLLSNEDLQPTVEEVADNPEDDSVLDSNVWAEEDGPDSRRESASSNMEDFDGDIGRRHSMRTEALIHAAAKNIVEAVADAPRDSIQSAASAPEEEETSFATESYTESHRQSLGAESEAGHSQASEDHAAHTAHADEGGDSSSHHEHEDDVFSDNSPRSSMGSMSEAERDGAKQISPPKTRTARISDIPQSDADEEFVPTIRGTRRPTFRSPSSVMAMQMSSPPASATGTPRSSRRTPRSTVSRLGSPSVSAQYSPRKTKTPPRFKRNTPPLVLLHVTVLPSRWVWGHVLDNAQPSELSPEGKTLWESWNQLQDRTADTISDRGILLPHPQNDYEVLEERLLETLDLPLRRRARILECGHYLGPSNEMSLSEEMESEDEDYYDEHRSPRQSMAEQTHWCKTCSSQIRYDSLGDGKVYRVKVYASNGLMRAGAWEACWKDMERVDVELEPIIDSKLQEELTCLAAEQERALEMEEQAAAAAAAAVDEEIQQHEEEEAAERSYMPEHMDMSVHMEEPPQPEIHAKSSPPYENDCEMGDEKRLREVYGSSPPPRPESSSIPQPRRSDLVSQETPASPSVEALERREERRESRQQAYKSSSLPELILEAVKVLMKDQKNVLIGLLSLVVLVLAARSGSTPTDVGVKAVVPEPVIPVVVEKPAETASGMVDPSTVDAEQQPARETINVENEPKVEIMESAQASSTTQVSETLLNAAPTSTIEITRTVTKAMTETRTETMIETVTATKFETITEMVPQTITETMAETITETMVETVTVEALPTETAKDVPNIEKSEAVGEETIPEQVSVGDEGGDGMGEEL
ncbi:hypothetical protein J3458_000030 [Metarhizium acridum]|uniref:uncharacterized protein n=1 Tax=Metarhizium acridum TaxID=92637 RepID=UPI001C6C84B5|nr:hypothetical protein J3458_000030 [Metarhizium acridum]